MPIDPDLLIGAELPPTTTSWDVDDVILYHLGLGAGEPPIDQNELEYTYEENLKVLPTFAVTPAFPVLTGLSYLPGFDIDPRALLHGEQEIEVNGSLPPLGSVRTRARVIDVQDKRTGALVTVETTSQERDDPELCFTNRFSSFIRGEGGFGPTSSARSPAPEAPARPPDRTILRRTMPQQALLYRLSGDKNPMHAVPALASAAGFDRPILHGLCTLGMTCKAIVDAVLGGDVTPVRTIRTRFAGIVYPGEHLRIDLWQEPGRVAAEVSVPERDGIPVLSRCVVTLEEAA